MSAAHAARDLTAAQPFALRHVTLRNRIVGTPHGRGLLRDGLATAGDARYWRRVASGGAAMVTVGGTVTAPESTWRRRIVTEAWRDEGVAGMRLRADAIRAEGAVAACQLVHLGRETTGADMWFAPVAPSAVRSPREPTRPRALSDGELDAIVEGFRLSALNAARAGFQVVELHAAHGYLLAQFLAASTNHRPDAGSVAGRAGILARTAGAIREGAPEIVLGVRLSAEGDGEGGFTLDGLCTLLGVVSAHVDYVSLTVGVRATYVRDMATTEPPLLRALDRLRAATDRPLLVGQAFRRVDEIEAALAAGADLVGVARPLIADPDFPAKLLAGRASEIRPCVSCNEDCRAFDPVLLCSVNPDLGPSPEGPRPGAPLAVRRNEGGGGRRVAILGAGPAGLECAISLPAGFEVVLFDERDDVGGHLAIAAGAPHRSGWRALLEFYARTLARANHVEQRLLQSVGPGELGDFDHVVIAIGSEEVLPDLPGAARTIRSSEFIAQPGEPSARKELVVVDDGFGWWPCASAIETAISSGWATITVLTPAASFGARLPPEGAVQLLSRLRGAPLQIRPLTVLLSVGSASVRVRNVMSGQETELEADRVVAVGERQARDWGHLVPDGLQVSVIGDAVVPRRVHHAISEGRAAARELAQLAGR